MDRWPHQIQGVQDVLALIEKGVRRICLTSPTGGGKSRMIADLATRFIEKDLCVSLYTNRRMLISQISEGFFAQGILHGVRARGYDDDRHRSFQVSSLQTEHSRCVRSRRWELHPASLVLVDEAHLHKNTMALRILQEHERQGAILVGVTATPLGLGGVYDELVVAGRTSDLRACGALVPCIHYGPDEPDLRHIVRVPLGVDLSEKDNRKAIMTPGIFGRVIHWYRRINPEQKPTILFAPGVPESIWFCEQFRKEKISCAHIDGKEVWIDGKTYPSTGPLRKEILDGSREKRFAVVANRFVLREGIDAPWLEHGIFATVFGSLQSYLQSGGRLLRANPGIKRVTLQDHGGNWWRHGSLNADREWRLGLTDRACAGEREDSFTYPKTETPSEPLRCPRCSCILTRLRCLCGWEAQSGQKSRPVIQADGNLKEMTGDIFKPRRISSSPDGPAIWREMYFRARSPKWNATFKQAEAMYYYEQGVWPDRRWPLMPKADHDFYRKVQDVTSEKLR